MEADNEASFSAGRFVGPQISSKSAMDDSSSPYFLHHSDSPGVALVSQVLTGENYASWSRAMKIALSVKNKLGFIDGTIKRPASTEVDLLNAWVRNNNVVISWILNSVSKDISASIIFAETAYEIWMDLRDRFMQKNGPRVFTLRRELMNLMQGQNSVSVYFTKLKTIWEELSNYRPVCTCGKCDCGGVKELNAYYQAEHIMSFLEMNQVFELMNESMAKTSTKNVPHELLLEQIHSTLIELIKISLLALFFSLESLFIVQQWEPICHILNFSSLLLFLFLKSYISTFSSPVYLVDFSCLKPPNFCRVPFSTYIEHAKMMDFWDNDSVDFMAKILTHSGQGEQTYLPPSLHYIPPKSGHQESLQEVHMVLFPVLESLLNKTLISPSEIDVLIVNCSGFCPSPSLSSIIINKFCLKQDVKSYNISGMGCSASVLAIDMAKNILKTHKNSNAVILSTEILSTGWYAGKDRPKMVLNCMFRTGAAAILISNKKEAKKTAKYKLLWSLRTLRAFDDKAYYSAFREEDSDGLTGVTLRRELLQVAGETLRSNISLLGLKVLPFTEIIWYILSVMKKRFVNKSNEIYVPNFKNLIQHFCLPCSGKPVILEIGKGLKLDERDMEPALMTLHRFGNQSSSSLWYELAYMEAKERVKKGDKVWQLGMGSGPKCNSLVWKCIRPITSEAQKGAWADSVHTYPLASP